MQSSRRNETTAIAKNQTIVLRLRGFSDLLIADPSPLSQGIITPEAETYIIKKAKQLSVSQPIHLVVELPGAKMKSEDEAKVGETIKSHFRNAAKIEAVEIRELLRNGYKALMMGLLVLSTCLVLAWFFAEKLSERPIPRLLQESFVILGWVSMWRPIEIFLYEWLPLLRRKNLFLRLSDAVIKIKRI